MFKVSRESLAGALTMAQTCVEPKGTIPVLSFALFELKAGRLSIQTTDLDVTLDTTIEAEGDDEAFCIPAKDITRLVGLFDGDTVQFTRKENGRAVVSCGKSRYTLPTVERDAYPNVEAVIGKHFLIKGSMLKTLMERAVFCVSDDQFKHAMQGVLLETKSAKLSVVATDGYRAAILRYSIPFSEEVSGVLPRRAVNALTRAFVSDDPVKVTISGDAAKFEQGETVIRGRLLVEQFVKYELIIPKERKHSVVIAEDARRVLRRSAITAEEITVSKAPEVFFDVSSDGIQVRSEHRDKGEGVEFIPAQCETLNGDAVPLKFASRYLTDILAFEAEINLAFDDNNSQFLLTPHGLREYEYRYVVMPCRI